MSANCVSDRIGLRPRRPAMTALLPAQREDVDGRPSPTMTGWLIQPLGVVAPACALPAADVALPIHRCHPDTRPHAYSPAPPHASPRSTTSSNPPNSRTRACGLDRRQWPAVGHVRNIVP